MSVFSDAAIARIETIWAPGRVYKPRKVPSKPITPYVSMYADTGRSTVAMNDGTAGAGAHRLMPMAVGASVDEVDRAVAGILAALSDHRLAVAGFDCTPLWFESSGNYVDDPDGGVRISQTLFFTFHATPKE